MLDLQIAFILGAITGGFSTATAMILIREDYRRDEETKARDATAAALANQNALCDTDTPTRTTFDEYYKRVMSQRQQIKLTDPSYLCERKLPEKGAVIGFEPECGSLCRRRYPTEPNIWCSICCPKNTKEARRAEHLAADMRRDGPFPDADAIRKAAALETIYPPPPLEKISTAAPPEPEDPPTPAVERCRAMWHFGLQPGQQCGSENCVNNPNILGRKPHPLHDFQKFGPNNLCGNRNCTFCGGPQHG